MGPDTQPIRFEGVHCHLELQNRPPHIVLIKISGTDVGEFGDAPMKAIEGWIRGVPAIDLFIDARDVRGASIDVSRVWAGWLSAHSPSLRSITMLTGSRFINVTAEFVRRFASLEDSMRVCADPAVFDRSLRESTRRLGSAFPPR
jgi:hypothetical protein